MKVLVIEDEPEMRDNIAHSLHQENYIVETVDDYFSAKKTGHRKYNFTNLSWRQVVKKI